ncbi:MAG TPA: peptidase M16, partial [Gammaproteobacteria bacterium]|nr:peptidase M16 [Gammaproteobacteria bacterium]
ADSLQSGQAASPIAAPIPVSSAQEIHVDFPSTQTHIFVAQLGMAMNDPDYFPLYVGNHVLGGGGFISRLMEEVRSKRGLSYSVYSYFQPMQQTGPFLVGL